jgi:retinol dehydrogenase 12
MHVLINNAGLGNTKRLMTEDAIEMVFAVNHLAYCLLTMQVLDRIKQGAPARIVNVASEAHRFGTINFDDLTHTVSYSADATPMPFASP